MLLLHNTQTTSSASIGVTAIASYDEQIIKLIVWICPDPTLYDMVEKSLIQYRTVDDINKSLQDKVSGYRNALWLVNTIKYSRTTADTAPGPNRSSQNLCFVQVPDEKIVVFVAAVVS
ncbi:hypothetical protein CRE_25390 [Caenorhabditis remanei]|uniref:Uncharacterized protein n=1 Tax=Caenorhabditis remanei TaxID=31234 RepID=E3LSX2_CAERE|nr:hypothetical protein CRE_25390 [Caenorhabditis remanei]